ncbi:MULTISPECIES: hypothetical protein [unclassified Moorena]|uniref:hypothetical protein n=1 Tax=unclassified Moorena TaxID=2683338 RepID=UPI00141834AD|nr:MULTISPECIES: hypothetical protein [unclassified Moorena]NEO12733.1 hypothetical protein [Moorena sp. SIO3E8]
MTVGHAGRDRIPETLCYSTIGNAIACLISSQDNYPVLMQSLMGETPKTALHRLIKIFPISPSPYLPISPPSPHFPHSPPSP